MQAYRCSLSIMLAKLLASYSFCSSVMPSKGSLFFSSIHPMIGLILILKAKQLEIFKIKSLLLVNVLDIFFGLAFFRVRRIARLGSGGHAQLAEVHHESGRITVAGVLDQSIDILFAEDKQERSCQCFECRVGGGHATNKLVAYGIAHLGSCGDITQRGQYLIANILANYRDGPASIHQRGQDGHETILVLRVARLFRFVITKIVQSHDSLTSSNLNWRKLRSTAITSMFISSYSWSGFSGRPSSEILDKSSS